jgi:hypothetical protein
MYIDHENGKNGQWQIRRGDGRGASKEREEKIDGPILMGLFLPSPECRARATIWGCSCLLPISPRQEGAQVI